LRISVMKKKSASGKTHNSKDAIKRLRKHALNLSADKTRGREIEVGERQHVAFDAAFFFLVQSHDHEHGDEGGGNRGGGLETDVAEKRAEEGKGKPNGGPYDKRYGQEPVGESLLAAAFQPEDIGNSEKHCSRREN